MVDGMPSSVADAKRVIGTVCVPCVDGKMVQSPIPCSSTATIKCEHVHTDIGGPLIESLGGSGKRYQVCGCGGLRPAQAACE